jgi:hypothetical protein
MGEIYIQKGRSLATLPQSINQPRTQLGLRYIPVETIDVDFIYGHNITGRGAR